MCTVHHPGQPSHVSNSLYIHDNVQLITCIQYYITERWGAWTPHFVLTPQKPYKLSRFYHTMGGHTVCCVTEQWGWGPASLSSNWTVGIMGWPVWHLTSDIWHVPAWIIISKLHHTSSSAGFSYSKPILITVYSWLCTINYLYWILYKPGSEEHKLLTVCWHPKNLQFKSILPQPASSQVSGSKSCKIHSKPTTPFIYPLSEHQSLETYCKSLPRCTVACTSHFAPSGLGKLFLPQICFPLKIMVGG